MVLNKNGQVLLYTLMLSTLIIVSILFLAKPTKEIITTTLTDMNCTDSTISEYDQATCYGYDILFWVFISMGIAIAFVVLGSKLIGG